MRYGFIVDPPIDMGMGNFKKNLHLRNLEDMAYQLCIAGKIIGNSPAVSLYNKTAAQKFKNCEVAVKVLPEHASTIAQDEFIKEIAFMKTLDYNDHIVNMLGCVTASTPLSLVVELCSCGDLLRFLRRQRSDYRVCFHILIPIHINNVT